MAMKKKQRDTAQRSSADSHTKKLSLTNDKLFWGLVVTVTAFKLLLIPSYRSTDFEVHRNWLAITSSLPLLQWYHEDTSEWTLDYPPFFAWFEWLLARFAPLFDPEMLRVSNLNYASPDTILFQRLTVIISDIAFLLAARWYCRVLEKQGYLSSPASNTSSSTTNTSTTATLSRDLPTPTTTATSARGVVLALAILNPGLLLVDHVHFQYNGFLTGLLLLSMGLVAQQRDVATAIAFAALLNFKHIYLYCAAPFAVYLFVRNNPFTSPWRFVLVAMATTAVFAASVGPLIAVGGIAEIKQLLSRLFPFGRGLCHAYWAPNFWALYNLIDKVIATALGRNIPGAAALTGGLVGADTAGTHAVLFSPKPSAALGITVVSLLPLCYYIWNFPTEAQRKWPVAVAVSTLCFFMFGWHVHEKAIIGAIVPLGFAVSANADIAVLWFVLSTVGHYSLFPLLFTPAEIVTRNIVWISFTVLSWAVLKSLHGERLRIGSAEKVYLAGLVVLEVFALAVHPLVPKLARLPFLPLLLISCYCALGVTVCFVGLYIRLLRRKS